MTPHEPAKPAKSGVDEKALEAARRAYQKVARDTDMSRPSDPVRAAIEAYEAHRTPVGDDAVRVALKDAFITCIAETDDPYVKLQFKTLAEAQRFHQLLVGPEALRSSVAPSVRGGERLAYRRLGPLGYHYATDKMSFHASYVGAKNPIEPLYATPTDIESRKPVAWRLRAKGAENWYLTVERPIATDRYDIEPLYRSAGSTGGESHPVKSEAAE